VLAQMDLIEHLDSPIQAHLCRYPLQYPLHSGWKGCPVFCRQFGKGPLDCVSLRMAVALRDCDAGMASDPGQRKSITTGLRKAC